MKILVISSYFYPHIGGSERYIEDLYSTLSKQHKNVQVDILCYNTNNSPSFEKYKNFNIYRIPAIEILPDQFAIPNYFSLLKITSNLKKNNYDLVNSHTRFFDNSWWAPFLSKYLGAKSILTDHCATHPVHESFLVNIFTKILDFITIPLLNKFYDYKIAVSKSTKKFLKSHGMNDIEVFYGGVNLNHIEKAVKIKDKNKVVISFVGRMIPSKGPEVLLEVAKNILKDKNSVNLEFNFAGDGKLYKKLKINESSEIHFLGHIDKKKVSILLSKTDIFVLPTTHHEGLPISLLEAGISHCSVVTSPQGGISELITNNESGFLVQSNIKEIEEKVRLLIKDKKLRKKLSDNLYNIVKKKFIWSKISKDYYSFLERISF